MLSVNMSDWGGLRRHRACAPFAQVDPNPRPSLLGANEGGFRTLSRRLIHHKNLHNHTAITIGDHTGSPFYKVHRILHFYSDFSSSTVRDENLNTPPQIAHIVLPRPNLSFAPSVLSTPPTGTYIHMQCESTSSLWPVLIDA